MPKLTLASLTSSYRSNAALNANFDAIEAAIENTLSRDGTAPNAMAANLDMGSNRVVNLDAPVDDNDAIRKVDVDLGIGPDITTVADNITSVTTVATNISDVTAVSADLTGADTIGDASALLAITAPGIVAKDTGGSPVSRTITGSTGISVTNGDGGAGNPTISLDAELVDISGITPVDGTFIVGDGADFVGETGDTALTSLGGGTTGIAVFKESSAGAIRTTLSLVPGSDVLAYDANLQAFVDAFTAPTSDGVAGQYLKTDGAGTLTFATPAGSGDTLSAANETITGDWTYNGDVAWNGVISGSSVKDEDDMASDSDTSIPTQQSVKAYSDNQWVADYAALKALSGGLYSSVLVEDESRGGVFVWRSGDQSANVTADPSEGVWVPPSSDATGASGAWERQVTGEGYNVKWFGAAGDGSTDDTTAFQNAIDFAKDGNSVFVPKTDNSYVVGALTIDGAIAVFGDGSKTKISIKPSTTNWCVLAASNITFENLEFINGANCTGALFLYDTSAATYERFAFRNIRTNALAGLFVDDDNAGGNRLDEIYYESITLVLHANIGFRHRDSFAFLFFDHCVVDYVGSAAPNFPGFTVSGAEGVVFTRCEVTGTAFVGATSTSQKGFSISSSTAVFFEHCFADTTGGEPYDLDTINSLHMTDCTASLADRPFTISACTDPQAAKIRIVGRSALGSKTASQPGLLIDGGTAGAQLNGIKVQNATGDGVFIDHTTANSLNRINGLHATSNGGYGLRSSGTTGNPSGVYSGLFFNGNTSGDHSLANQGAGSGFERAVDGILNSGDYEICGGSGTVGGDLTVSGDLSGTTASLSGNFDVDTDTFFVDVSEDRASVNTTSPKVDFHIQQIDNAPSPTLGTASGGLYLASSSSAFGLLGGVNNGNGDVWLQVQRTDTTATAYNLLLQPSGGDVYVGQSSGSHKLDVNGDINATSGNVYRVNGTQVVGVQQSGTGETAGFTAGAGAGVNDDSTFTGNVGSTAYRVSDIVKALKNHGLIAT